MSTRRLPKDDPELRVYRRAGVPIVTLEDDTFEAPKWAYDIWPFTHFSDEIGVLRRAGEDEDFRRACLMVIQMTLSRNAVGTCDTIHALYVATASREKRAAWGKAVEYEED